MHQRPWSRFLHKAHGGLLGASSRAQTLRGLRAFQRASHGRHGARHRWEPALRICTAEAGGGLGAGQLGRCAQNPSEVSGGARADGTTSSHFCARSAHAQRSGRGAARTVVGAEVGPCTLLQVCAPGRVPRLWLPGRQHSPHTAEAAGTRAVLGRWLRPRGHMLLWMALLLF